MLDRPTAGELLEALTDYLRDQVLPNVTGTVQYHTRVALNIAQILTREAAQYPQTLSDERDRLVSLLGTDVPPGTLADQVLALNTELQNRLRNGAALDERAVWSALSEACAIKLAISRPGYDRYDMAVEAEPASSIATADQGEG